jgi:hypothetical protein
MPSRTRRRSSRLGFVPTGDVDEAGEVIMRLTLG